MLWGAIKAGVRLKLGLANPFEIKPQFKLLKNELSQITVNLLQKRQVSQTEHVLRFCKKYKILALPDENKCLGLMIGQYVELHVNGEKRPYNPISRIDEPGQVDFLITDLRKTNGSNSFTNHLLSLKEKDAITLKGPFTQYIYRGYGRLEWPGKEQKKYKNIGMIAFQSGITGVYTLIDSLMSNYDNQTGLSLLWVGEQLDSFLFQEEFSTLAEQQKLNCNLMLRQLKPGWVGPFGSITKQHIQSFMPPSSEDTALILIGGPQDMDHLRPILSQLKYQNVLFPIQSS